MVELVSNGSIFSNYFHFPKGKSPEYSKLRNKTTAKWGHYTEVVMILFIIGIPILNYIRNNRTYTRKLLLFKRINTVLNKYINKEQRTGWDRRLANLALKGKHFLFTANYHMGTMIIVLFWTVVLSVLSLSDIYHGDLIFLAKRLGKIIVVCLPTIFFLTLRPSPLPDVLYLTLLPIHKWLSRLVIVQSIIHTILYCFYFQKKGTMFKTYTYKNLCGWVALLGFIIIMITSLLKLRNKYYRLFYFQHYVWSWIIVIALQIHARPTKATPYTILNVLILVSQIVYRLRITKKTFTTEDLKVVEASPNLSYIEFPNDVISKPALKPGAHIRLTEYHSSFIVRAYKQLIPNYHPYTLVSLPLDNYQKLIVRQNTFKIQNGRKYLICGTYDPHLAFIKTKGNPKKFSIAKLSSTAKRILMVVGGSAISFALPILRVMSYEGIPIKVIWVIKDFRDVCILKYFDGFIHEDDFEIFVTGEPEISNDQSISRYGSIGKISLAGHSSPSLNYGVDSDEIGEEVPLLKEERFSLIRENEIENVDISIDELAFDEEEEDEVCERQDYDGNFTREELNFGTHSVFSDQDSNQDSDENNDFDEDYLSPLSQPTTHSRRSSMNERFVPDEVKYTSNVAKDHIRRFHDCVNKLNISNKIYKGRPKLNYKYYNWCINQGFTQCSGPVEDGSHNLICCKDLPKNKVVQEDIDLDKIWVVSAGPKGLVQNVKVWAEENDFKFHEEAFYV